MVGTHWDIVREAERGPVWMQAQQLVASVNAHSAANLTVSCKVCESELVALWRLFALLCSPLHFIPSLSL